MYRVKNEKFSACERFRGKVKEWSMHFVITSFRTTVLPVCVSANKCQLIDSSNYRGFYVDIVQFKCLNEQVS